MEIIGKFQNIRPNTIAAALSDSFYWQSKARQSINRAERVLFFFTALEAIVSRRDTTTPVSETVARSTASLMSTEHAARSEISAELKKMYASRSKIVHQGMASTYASVGSRLQEIVEIITKRVIKEADLGKPLNSFHEHLTEASFGSQLDLSKL